jgi:hypothetical protein
MPNTWRLKLSKVLIFAAVVASTPALAADVQIDVQNFTLQNGIARATMLVTNTSERAISNVYVDCAFLGADKRAIGLGKANIRRLPAKGDAYAEAAFVTNAEVKFVDCRGVDGSF